MKKWLYAFLLTTLTPFSQVTAQWTTPVPIDTTSSGGGQLGGYMALDDSGNIYVTWAGYTPSSSQQSVVIQRSTNRGATWTRTDYAPGSDLARTPTDIEADHNGTVWLLWHSLANEFAPTYLNLSKSTDNGRTFTTAFRSRAYANGFMHSKLAVDAQNSIYMLWDDAQFKLTKFRHGDITQRADTEIPNDTLSIDYNPDLAVSRDFVVHCVWEGFFYEPNTGYHEFVFCSTSTDTGATFYGRTRVDTVDRIGPSYVQHYPAIAVDSTEIIFISYARPLEVNQSNVRVAKSTNGGQSFISPIFISDYDTAYSSALCIDSKGGANILLDSGAGTEHLRSTNGGITFEQSRLVSIRPKGLRAAREGFLYASGDRGLHVYFTKTNILLSVRPGASSSHVFELLQNYPNPFNSSTIIQFTLGEKQRIDLRIFDMIGREIALLISERFSPGSYSTIWDARNVSSGIYFLRLTTESNFVQTRKIILLR